MRVLMLARAGVPSRMTLAAAALAQRGHELLWSGPRPAGLPDAVVTLAGPRARWSARADVVLGDGADPFGAARAGWFARAHCQVLALDAATVRRWSAFERWCWDSLHAHGLIEPQEAEGFQGGGLALDLERIALWSDETAPGEPDPAHLDAEILERACERALARQRGRGVRPALFVDRDGTLVKEVGYLADPNDLHLLPGVPAALRSAQAAGLAVVVISNQSGVGRGLFPLSRVYEAMARLRGLLRAEGVELDAIYFCPHRPEAECPCRKPRPGLLQRAAEDLQLALQRSVMVGDKRLDAETGHQAGALGVLVRTGYGREEERAADPPGVAPPDTVCDDLAAALHWYLAREPFGD